MRNNKENLLLSIEEFLCSEEKCMFITGTHQYRKHIMVMAALDHLKPKSHILFRSGTTQNLLDREFLGRFISKQPKIGQTLELKIAYMKLIHLQIVVHGINPVENLIM